MANSVSMRLDGVRTADGRTLHGVEFIPTSCRGGLSRGVDRFGRRLYRPIVEGTMNGSAVTVVPMESGVFLSEPEARAAAASWAQLV